MSNQRDQTQHRVFQNYQILRVQGKHFLRFMLSDFKTCLHVNARHLNCASVRKFRLFHLPTGEVESKHGEPGRSLENRWPLPLSRRQRAVSPLFVLFVRAAHSRRFTGLTALPAPPKVTATAGRLQVIRLPSARWKLSQSQRRAPTSRDLVSLLNKGGCNPLLTYLVCYKRPLCYGIRIPAWKLNIRNPSFGWLHKHAFQ